MTSGIEHATFRLVAQCLNQPCPYIMTWTGGKFGTFAFGKMKETRIRACICVFFLKAHQLGGSYAIHRFTGRPGQAPSSSLFPELAVVGNDCQSSTPSGSSFRTLFSLAGGGNKKESSPIFQRERGSRIPKLGSEQDQTVRETRIYTGLEEKEKL